MMFSRLCWRPNGNTALTSVSAMALNTADRQEPEEAEEKNDKRMSIIKMLD